MEIGVLGATGPAGRGLAARLAALGHDVRVGSRERARAESVVTELRQRWGERVERLEPGTNAEAAKAADLVIVATTWEGAVATAAEHADDLEGKPLIAMANAVERRDAEFRPVLHDAASLSEAVQAAVPAARVVAAFQHIPAAAFAALDDPIEGDVVVCADDDDARRLVLGLVAGIPNLRAFDGGSLANALGVETFAALLLTLNVRHRGRGTLRVLGLESYQPDEAGAPSGAGRS